MSSGKWHGVSHWHGGQAPHWAAFVLKVLLHAAQTRYSALAALYDFALITLTDESRACPSLSWSMTLLSAFNVVDLTTAGYLVCVLPPC